LQVTFFCSNSFLIHSTQSLIISIKGNEECFEFQSRVAAELIYARDQRCATAWRDLLPNRLWENSIWCFLEDFLRCGQRPRNQEQAMRHFSYAYPLEGYNPARKATKSPLRFRSRPLE